LAQKWLAWCTNEGLDISAELTVWPFVRLWDCGLAGFGNDKALILRKIEATKPQSNQPETNSSSQGTGFAPWP
jgi:hypothetical protein